MITRVGLYARYSSDNQREASLEDQFRLCRDHAAREGWEIAGVYQDAGISGSSTILRPGIQKLVRDAQCREFDVVVAEALDRISRDQADVATLYKHLKFAGVPIVTLAEGTISELHVGLKGTMNALFLKDLAMKTRRGLRGRVEAGKSGGGLCYGYRVVKKFDANGEALRGDREIVSSEAEIVRRIFHEFAAGTGPRAIAKKLNEEGIDGPESKLWNDTTIRGHVKRGTGIINNELYIGRLIWNRQRYVKDPSTGRRVSRLNPDAEWIVSQVPELRIVEDKLWESVKARQQEIAQKHINLTEAVRRHHNNRLSVAHRPKSLLSGLVFCGSCDGPCSLRGGNRFVCSNHVGKGSCPNNRTIAREKLEGRVLAGLKDRMMAPEAAEAAMRAYAEETNRLNRERRSNGDNWRAELAKTERELAKAVDAILAGVSPLTLKEKIGKLETRKTELTELLADIPDTKTPDLLPSASAIYAKKIGKLTEAINQPDNRAEAAEALRGLIERVTLIPGAKRGEMDVMLTGELGTILNWVERQVIESATKKNTPGAGLSGVSLSVVAGAGNHQERHLFRSQFNMR